MFRKCGFWAANERGFLGGAALEVVNNYIYLGLTFSTGHSFTAAMEDTSEEGHARSIESVEREIENSNSIFFFSPKIVF